MTADLSVRGTARPVALSHDRLASRYVVAGLMVAVLDLSFAATYWVVLRGAITFPRLLKGIAAGVLGRAALQDGASVAWLGLLVHCTVAFGWTALFLLMRARWPAFRRALSTQRGIVSIGVAYGASVWLVMDFIVIPLSGATPTPLSSSWFYICLVWHMIGVGPPMAIILRD
ncbi:MAG TPA: hypothetical protein VGM20_04120 [Gemmatimonadales bacterium]|jgi:hypothetical protein